MLYTQTSLNTQQEIFTCWRNLLNFHQDWGCISFHTPVKAIKATLSQICYLLHMAHKDNNSSFLPPLLLQPSETHQWSCLKKTPQKDSGGCNPRHHSLCPVLPRCPRKGPSMAAALPRADPSLGFLLERAQLREQRAGFLYNWPQEKGSRRIIAMDCSDLSGQAAKPRALPASLTPRATQYELHEPNKISLSADTRTHFQQRTPHSPPPCQQAMRTDVIHNRVPWEAQWTGSSNSHTMWGNEGVTAFMWHSWHLD